MAVCGLHCRPNRNSVSGTCWKNRIDSNKTEKRSRRSSRSRRASAEPAGPPSIERSTVIARTESGRTRVRAAETRTRRERQHGDQRARCGSGRAACRSSPRPPASPASPARERRPSASRRTALDEEAELLGLWPRRRSAAPRSRRRAQHCRLEHAPDAPSSAERRARGQERGVGGVVAGQDAARTAAAGRPRSRAGRPGNRPRPR